MKKFIRNIVLFLLFVPTVYCLLIILWGEFVPPCLSKNLFYPLGGYGECYTRVRDVHNYRDIDVLFLGSSHMYRGFDPRVFREKGYSCFNLGTSSQSPLQSYILLKRYFDDLNPKLVVFEASPMAMVNDGTESALDLIANDRMDWDVLRMVMQVNDIKAYNSLIYAVYRRAFGRDRCFVKPSIDKNGDRYISGGYVERENSAFVKKRPVLSATKDPFGYQLEAFDRVLHFLHKRQVRVVLVQMPVYNGYDDSMNEFFADRGKYFNYNEINIGLMSTNYFLDDHHLNQAGAERLGNDFYGRISGCLSAHSQVKE